MKEISVAQQNSATRPDRPAPQLVVAWASMIPLFYFASGGGFWFQYAAMNTSMSYHYGSLVTASMTEENLVTALAVFAIVSALIFPRIITVIGLCLKDRVFASLSALALASCLWSQFPSRSLEFSLCLAFNLSFVFYLYRKFSPERLLGLFLMLGWICLAACITLSLYLPQYGTDSTLGSTGAWRGLYAHKNACSITTVILLSGAFYAQAKTMLARASRVIYVCLSVFVVIMTQSRTGWVLLASLLVYVSVMRLVQRFNSTERVAALILGATVALSLIIATIGYSSEILYFLGKDPTLTGRTEIWKSVSTSALKHPILGYGYMAFWKNLQGESATEALANHWAVTSAHNGMLELWLTLGAVGLGLVLYTFVRAFRDAFVCLRAGNSSYTQWYSCIAFLAVVTSLDEAELMIPNNLRWMLYVLACVGLSERAKAIRRSRCDG
jgi:exopolysaccharide production protein ExoQ